MATKKNINALLEPFGLSTRDLTKEQLVKARKACLGKNGFLSSEELISLSLRRRNK